MTIIDLITAQPCAWCLDDLRDGSHADCPGAPDFGEIDLTEGSW